MKFVLKNYFETSCKILFCTVLFWHAYMLPAGPEGGQENAILLQYWHVGRLKMQA